MTLSIAARPGSYRSARLDDNIAAARVELEERSAAVDLAGEPAAARAAFFNRDRQAFRPHVAAAGGRIEVERRGPSHRRAHPAAGRAEHAVAFQRAKNPRAHVAATGVGMDRAFH